MTKTNSKHQNTAGTPENMEVNYRILLDVQYSWTNKL